MEKNKNFFKTVGKAIGTKQNIIIGAGIVSILFVVMFVGALIFNNFGTSNKAQNIKKIDTIIEYLYNSNAYIELQAGEDLTLYQIYNKNKECFTESNYGGKAIYKSDNKMITYDTPCEIVDEISPLAMVEAMSEFAKDNKNNVVVTKSKDKNETKQSYNEYKIEIKGKENIRKCLSLKNENYANTMVEALSTYTNLKSEVDNASICVYINEMQDENKENRYGMTMTCKIGKEEGMLWCFDGYLLFEEWELPNEWHELSNEILEDKVVKDLFNTFKTYLDEKIEIFSQRLQAEANANPTIQVETKILGQDEYEEEKSEQEQNADKE